MGADVWMLPLGTEYDEATGVGTSCGGDGRPLKAHAMHRYVQAHLAVDSLVPQAVNVRVASFRMSQITTCVRT